MVQQVRAHARQTPFVVAQRLAQQAVLAGVVVDIFSSFVVRRLESTRAYG
jgi:hypothetical protein